MVDVDWTWLETINLLQVAVFIVAVYVITRLLMRFWPWLRKVMELTAALAQLPAFIVRTDRALGEQGKTLAAQNLKIGDIHHEVHFNNGTSVKDGVKRAEYAIERVELGVKGLYDRADASDAADEELRNEIEKTIPHPPKEKP